MTDRTGGCACGAIRFKITAPLMGVGVCHCSDCQKASGGGPNYVALAPKTAFEITKGEARVYHSKGDSGADAGSAIVRCAVKAEAGGVGYGETRRGYMPQGKAGV